nr:MAG TPA: hypothetical protein [Caudoviricetes sp.]
MRALFLPLDRGLPPFDRGYTVICFTFTAYMGGFLFPFFQIRRRSPKCFSDSKNKFSLKSTYSKNIAKFLSIAIYILFSFAIIHPSKQNTLTLGAKNETRCQHHEN